MSGFCLRVLQVRCGDLVREKRCYVVVVRGEAVMKSGRSATNKGATRSAPPARRRRTSSAPQRFRPCCHSSCLPSLLTVHAHAHATRAATTMCMQEASKRSKAAGRRARPDRTAPSVCLEPPEPATVVRAVAGSSSKQRRRARRVAFFAAVRSSSSAQRSSKPRAFNNYNHPAYTQSEQQAHNSNSSNRSRSAKRRGPIILKLIV